MVMEAEQPAAEAVIAQRWCAHLARGKHRIAFILADGRLSSILPVSYGIAGGMRSSDCNWGSPGIGKTANGRIWIPRVRGVVAIDPAAGSRVPPPGTEVELTAPASVAYAASHVRRRVGLFRIKTKTS